MIKTMYQNLEATLHDVFWAAEGACAELPLLEKFLTEYAGTALELGCGSGRLLKPLSEAGYLIEGLDNSQEMLALCEADVILHHAGMEDFSTGAVYGAITIPAFTLQLLPFESLPAILANIGQHLHPEGGLYITTFIPWAEITGELPEGEWFKDQETKLENGNTARCYTRFFIKRLSQKLTREHRYEIVSPQGKVIEKSDSTHHLTWFWPREMEHFLHEAGFSLEEKIGDFAIGSDWDDDSQIVTYVAKFIGDGC